MELLPGAGEAISGKARARLVERPAAGHTISRLNLMPFDPENLRLTDFMDLATLQEIQDNFAAVANVKAIITDADGKVLTQVTPTTEFLRRQRVIQQTEDAHGTSCQKEG